MLRHWSLLQPQFAISAASMWSSLAGADAKGAVLGSDRSGGPRQVDLACDRMRAPTKIRPFLKMRFGTLLGQSNSLFFNENSLLI